MKSYLKDVPPRFHEVITEAFNNAASHNGFKDTYAVMQMRYEASGKRLVSFPTFVDNVLRAAVPMALAESRMHTVFGAEEFARYLGFAIYACLAEAVDEE